MTANQAVVAASRLACVIVVTVVLALPAPAVAQRVTGTVTGIESDSEGIQGIQVTFFDAVNAETLGSATTDFAGVYDSGLIPAGSYRVRFWDQFGVGKAAPYSAEFSGDGGVDSFCSATVIPVLLGGTSTVNEAMRPSEPSLAVLSDGAIVGTVRSAATGAPLAGVEVRLLGSNAQALAILETDANGVYTFEFHNRFFPRVRLGFFDPTGVYFPQFFAEGAAASYDFCAGSLLNLSERKGEVDVWLEPVPPAQQTEHLTDAIEALSLPSNVESMLRTPLTQTVALLTDANANNDAGVCAQLTSFISRVNIQENKGQLSPADASALRASTAAILDALGCQ